MIKIIDDLNPEDNAMLQALYSRSSASVVEHLEKVKATGSGKFMESYYTGYGHKSIGDCGTTTIFIEDVSILAAKAIQAHPLYNGQETSTRYLYFSGRRIVDPIGTEASKKLLEDWMLIYNLVMEHAEDMYRDAYPLEAGWDETKYEKAIKAKCFDLARGFLPAGMTTQLSWHTTLSHARQVLDELQYHPLAEVREVAADIWVDLQEKYPSSFAFELGNSAWRIGEDFFHTNIHNFLEHDFKCVDYPWTVQNKILLSRPKKTMLPRTFDSSGQYVFLVKMDYGGFRDIQRHRNGVCTMPIVRAFDGLHEWYTNQLPNYMWSMLGAQMLMAHAMCQGDAYLGQYYCPLATNVRTMLRYSLPQAVYVAELRSQQTVHPTVRRVAQNIGKEIRGHIGADKIALYVDFSADKFSLKRGEQDIVEKQV